MFRLPPDKYGFRHVLCNVLHTPCIVVWLYVLIFHLSSLWLAAVLAIFLGLATAWLLARLLFLPGYAGIAFLEPRRHGRRNDG